MHPQVFQIVQHCDALLKNARRWRFNFFCLSLLNGGLGIVNALNCWSFDNLWLIPVGCLSGYVCFNTASRFFFHRRQVIHLASMKRSIMLADAAHSRSAWQLHTDQFDAHLTELLK